MNDLLDTDASDAHPLSAEPEPAPAPYNGAPTLPCPRDGEDDGPTDSWSQFWASSFPPTANDDLEEMDHRPTVRPSGDLDEHGFSVASSGIHRIVPLIDDGDAESIEAAVQKLLTA
jgi:hypothetical protein